MSETEDELLKIKEGGKIILIYLRKSSAVQDPLKDENTIIEPADKGSTILLWDREDYLKECNEQLSNKNVYEKCNEFPAVQLNKEIRSILLSMLSEKEIE